MKPSMPGVSTNTNSVIAFFPQRILFTGVCMFRTVIKAWDVDAVASWVEHDIGLKDAASIFVKRKINGAALTALTEEDLIEMGIDSSAERSKILTGLNVLMQPSKWRVLWVLLHAQWTQWWLPTDASDSFDVDPAMFTDY